MNTFKFSYPKSTSTSAQLNKKFKEFRDAQKAPTLASIPKKEIHVAKPVKGVNLFAKDVMMIHEIARSTSPLSEAISNQKVNPEQIIGTLSSALISLEFVKMQAAIKKATAAAKSDVDKKTLAGNYEKAIENFKMAYSSIGIKGIDEKRMQAFSTELMRDKNAFDSIVNISNSKQVVKGSAGTTLNEKSVAMGKFETTLAKLDDALLGNIILPANLCSGPLAQGTFTKHFGHSFSLQVTISLPCIVRWGGPFGCHCIPIFGWCTHTYTIASLSYNVDLSVGYKVNCCGGLAWGHASANVCASLLGVSFCAGCSADIIGAVGISRTPSGGNCIYGLGLTAQLKCTFGGITVLYVTYPFGYTLTGPCPPLPCTRAQELIG